MIQRISLSFRQDEFKGESAGLQNSLVSSLVRYALPIIRNQRVCSLFFIIILLHGCSSFHTVNNRTLLNSTAEKLEKQYKIRYADLALQYDLTNQSGSNKCLYIKNLGKIINDPKQNSIFLKRFKKNNYTECNGVAERKVKMIKMLLAKLNNKYKFLSESEMNLISKFNSNNHINELYKLDKITRSIPIMTPEHQAKITSHYGLRKHPVKKRRKFHCGTDLKGNVSAPIYATANGKVIKISKNGNYGNMIEILHSHKFITRYAHLKQILVKEGYLVVRGEMIGTQGKTGNATAEHLHYEILLDNKAINSFDFFSYCLHC